MKDYNEMAQSVLARIDTERAKNRRRRRIALSGVSAVCILLAVSVLIGYMGRDGGNVGPAL